MSTRTTLYRRETRKKRTSNKLIKLFFFTLPLRYRVLLLLLLGAILLVALMIIAKALQYQAAQREYDTYKGLDIQYITPQPETSSPDSLAPSSSPEVTSRPYNSIKIDLLRKENKHAVAWLDIPGTNIQYPVVQGNDNEYYLTHTFERKKNASGALFLDYRSASDFSDFNPVIYGHNMRDGSMFHQLREYVSQDFFNDHTTLKLTLPHEERVYKILSAYICKDGFDFRAQNCLTPTAIVQFFQSIRARSAIKSSRRPGENDSCLTLVTCTSGTHDWHWIVHAVRIDNANVN